MDVKILSSIFGSFQQLPTLRSHAYVEMSIVMIYKIETSVYRDNSIVGSRGDVIVQKIPFF